MNPRGYELARMSATEARQRLGTREITATELVEACLACLERYNPTINAVVTLSETALHEARELDQRAGRGEPLGCLHGLPVGIKDVTPVAGLRTTFGSPLFADHVPGEDALVVRRLREAGAIVIGKTNTPEFAAGGNTFNDVFGRTRNPWDPNRSAGGSTGGGAAALATGMIMLAEGTDLGGSLRIPASFCGVVGLRPTPGLVPTFPSDDIWDDLQVTGPMGRTAADVALALQAMAGPSPLVPAGRAIENPDLAATVAAGPPRQPRLAYCPDIAGIGIEPDIERVCRAATELLQETGAAVESVELDLSWGREAFVALRGLWFVTQHYSRLDQIDRLGANVAANIESGLKLGTRELAAAERARGRIWHVFRELFERFDHLLTPCMAVPPFPVEENFPPTISGKPAQTYVDWIAPTFVLSLTGLPVVSVPCGRDAGGLPVGLQIVGKPSGEIPALALAHRIEQACPIGEPSLAGLEP